MTKNIALFIDGTWNDDRDGPYTNVRKLFARAELADPAKQVAHYMRGIGTVPSAAVDVPDWLRRADIRLKSKKWYVRLFDKALMAKNPLSRRLHAWVFGGVFGYGMSMRILEAYAFLVEHYERAPQDRIYIFGFSRGAYAARSLVCFIDKVGLLLKDRLDKVEEAYAIYESGGQDGLGELERFLRKVTGSGVVRGNDSPASLPVYLIGVWDTVRELGGPLWLQKIPLFDTKFHQHGVPSSEARTLSLDVAACPCVAARKDYSRSVHNVIRGRFILFTPTVRKFLRDMLEFNVDDGLQHHYLHESAYCRLGGPAIKYNFFQDAANAALHEVDDRTWDLYLMSAWRRRAERSVHSDPALCPD
jgi:uncharacterized protein (DUF2235 family)